MKNTSYRITKNNLLLIFISLGLILALFLAIAFSPASVFSADNPVSAFSADIVEGDVHQFSFVCESNNLKTLSLKFATYGRINDGTLNVSLSDNDGTLIDTWSTDCRDITDFEYIDFSLTAPLNDCKDKEYIVTIKSNSAPDFGVCLCCTDKESGFMSNGVETGTNACYILSYESTLYQFFSSGLGSEKTLGILALILLIITIPFAVNFVLNNYSHMKLLLMLIPGYSLVFFTHRIIEHSTVQLVSHKLYLLLAFVLITVIWIITTILSYGLLVKREFPIHKTAVVILSLLSLFSVFYNTPGSIPDEDFHYGFAYQYSNYYLGYATPLKDDFDQDGDVIIYMRDNDADLIRSAQALFHSLSESSYTYTINQLLSHDTNLDVNPYKIRENIREGMTLKFNIAFLAPIIPSIGITLGRILNLNALTTFYLGRIFNAAFFVLIAYFAIKTIPIGKNLLFAIYSIPMTISLSSSLSYDSFVISICILFTSLLIRVLYQSDKMSMKQFIGLAVLSILVITCKLAYTPLIGCIFAVPASKIPLKRSSLFKKALLATIIVCFFIALMLPAFRDILNTYIYPLLQRVGNGSYVGLFLGMLEMTTMTLIVKLQEILESQIFHAGWGQFYMPPYIYGMYYAMIFICACRKEHEKVFLKTQDKILSLSMIVISTILLALPLIMYKTPDGGDVIIGLNGRYFLCLLPLFALTFRPSLKIKDYIYKNANLLSVYLAFICWTYSLMMVFGTINS